MPPSETLLEQVPYGCLVGAPSLPMASGCDVGCRFCYQRGYDDAPVAPAALVEQLVDRALAEWERMHPRGSRLAEHVLLNVQADALQPSAELEDAAFRLARAFLDRRIGITLHTKGGLTRRFLDLCAMNRGRIRARVTLYSLDPEVVRQLEPNGAAPQDRLHTIAALAELDALAAVRIDPLLPGLGDDAEALGALLGALSERGVRRVTASYVHLRPALLRELEALLPPDGRAFLADAYRTQPWAEVGVATKAKLLPKAYREEGYARLRRLARGLDIEVDVCQCKNPDLSGEPCGAPEGRVFAQVARGALPAAEHARTLFPC